MSVDPAPEEGSLRGIDRLLELQELDLSIDRLASRRVVLESGEDVRQARLRAEEAEGGAGELRLAIDSIQREQRRLETEVDSLTRKAQAEERRLYDGSVANAKELDSMQHEIASLRTRRSRLEDELLEHMEKREELEERARSADAELAEANDRLQEIRGESAEELREIGEALASRSAERVSLLPAFDEELLELYEDLRRGKKGIGAAALEDGVCQGCHQKLSAMELDHLKRERGVKRCEYCRRILITS